MKVGDHLWYHLSHAPEVLCAPRFPSLLSCREVHLTPLVVIKETQCNEVNEN